MAAVPSKVASRIAAGIKRFQPILASAKSRDVNESDTVVIVMDMLQEVFGYDKYTEITTEYAIRGTYCDLAIKLDGSLEFLIELKSIGIELKDSFVKQAIDYAANQGVDWVLLTTGAIWRVYKVSFTKPIEHELVLEFNFLELNPKNEEHIEQVFMLAKESWHKESLDDYHAQKQALNRFTLAAIVLSDSALELIRRELRRVSPGIKIDTSEIRKVLELEVLKREVLDGEKADAARKLVSRAANRTLRNTKPNSIDPVDTNTVSEPASNTEPPIAPENTTQNEGKES